MGSKVLIT